MQRDTVQRRAIRQVFSVARRPLSSGEILNKAREIVPRIGQATVYRTLNAFCREGDIVPVDIPGHTPRYEKAGLGHHHHFVCEGCRKVFELAGCSYAGDAESRLPKGFTVKSHEVILYGQCRDCAV